MSGKTVTGTELMQGVYAYAVGPAYETPAECRFMRHAMSADVVGMSTAPEAIIATHCGMKVASLVLVSDMCVMDEDDDVETSHEQVLSVCRERAPVVVDIVKDFVRRLHDEQSTKPRTAWCGTRRHKAKSAVEQHDE